MENAKLVEAVVEVVIKSVSDEMLIAEADRRGVMAKAVTMLSNDALLLEAGKRGLAEVKALTTETLLAELVLRGKDENVLGTLEGLTEEAFLLEADRRGYKAVKLAAGLAQDEQLWIAINNKRCFVEDNLDLVHDEGLLWEAIESKDDLLKDYLQSGNADDEVLWDAIDDKDAYVTDYIADGRIDDEALWEAIGDKHAIVLDEMGNMDSEDLWEQISLDDQERFVGEWLNGTDLGNQVELVMDNVDPNALDQIARKVDAKRTEVTNLISQLIVALEALKLSRTAAQE